MWPRRSNASAVNSIWEGSGNVIVLDALRTMKKEPESLERLLAEIRLARDPRLEKVAAVIGGEMAESDGRRAIERLAIALQASLLVRFSPPAVADAFCASRVEGDSGRAFGTLGKGVPAEDVIAVAGIEG